MDWLGYRFAELFHRFLLKGICLTWEPETVIKERTNLYCGHNHRRKNHFQLFNTRKKWLGLLKENSSLWKWQWRSCVLLCSGIKSCCSDLKQVSAEYNQWIKAWNQLTCSIDCGWSSFFGKRQKDQYLYKGKSLFSPFVVENKKNSPCMQQKRKVVGGHRP